MLDVCMCRIKNLGVNENYAYQTQNRITTDKTLKFQTVPYRIPSLVLRK